MMQYFLRMPLPPSISHYCDCQDVTILERLQYQIDAEEGEQVHGDLEASFENWRDFLGKEKEKSV